MSKLAHSGTDAIMDEIDRLAIQQEQAESMGIMGRSRKRERINQNPQTIIFTGEDL